MITFVFKYKSKINILLISVSKLKKPRNFHINSKIVQVRNSVYLSLNYKTTTVLSKNKKQHNIV